MRFGMGEGFQFSSPYKWRCSKLFYRLFVYCSWLLIARDNSTGFTIQWFGYSNYSYINFPRSFSYVVGVSATHSMGSANGGGNATSVWINSNSQCYVKENYSDKNLGGWVIVLGFT